MLHKKIFISAGDVSSELHLSHVLKHYKKLVPEAEFFGLGGDACAAQGANLLMHCREFMVGGGPVDVIGKLPKLYQFLWKAEDLIASNRPHVAIVVDNGEINLKLASLLHFFKIPVLYYIPPKVWVWRSSRLYKIDDHVDKVVSILPFEEDIYRHWNIPFEYVGNPLLDEIDQSVTKVQAKAHLAQLIGVANLEESVVCAMPGSRFSEIKYHTALFAHTFIELAEQLKKVGRDLPQILLPIPNNLDLEKIKEGFKRALAGCTGEALWSRLIFIKGHSHLCMKAADAALIKSGTSTLEAGVLQTPMVITYQSGWLSQKLFKYVVRYKYPVGLVNLFLLDYAEKSGQNSTEPVIPELILEKAKPEDLARLWCELLVNAEAREKQLKALSTLPEKLRPPSGTHASQSSLSSSERVAEILSTLQPRVRQLIASAGE